MDSAPERGVPRLFIGNLGPGIGDDALRRSLSRYGTVRSVHRTPRFAHVSLLPADEGAIDRCVRLLHRAKWQGCELRVEVALEHWADKLKKEWAEDRAKDTAKPEEDADEAMVEKSGPERVSRPFKFSGKKIVFSDDGDVSVCDDEDIMARFDDDDTALLGNTPGLESAVIEGQVTDESSSERGGDDNMSDDSDSVASFDVVAVSSDHEKQTPAATIETDALEVSVGEPEVSESEASSVEKHRDPEPLPAPPPAAPRGLKPYSAPVASTFELFGLAEDPVPSMKRLAAVPTVAQGERKTKRSRAAATTRDDGYDEAALAAEADPGIVDIERERRLGRDVLAAMFPAEIIAAAPGEDACKSELDRVAGLLRKPGLFRGLVDGKGSKKKRCVVKGLKGVKGTAKRFKRFSGVATKDVGMKTGWVSWTGVSKVDEGHRRAGLYRSLIKAPQSH